MRLVILSHLVSMMISNTRDLNLLRSMSLLLTVMKLLTQSTVAILDPSHDPHFDPIQVVVVMFKVKDQILVMDLNPVMGGNRNLSTDLAMVDKRRWSMVGDLSRVMDLVMVEGRRLNRSMDLVVVEELRLSMVGDLNQGLDLVMVGDRSLSMSVSLAMEGLRNKKKVIGSLAMEDLRNKRKEVTGNLVMGGLMIRWRVTLSLAMEDLRNRRREVTGSLVMGGLRNRKRGVTGSSLAMAVAMTMMMMSSVGTVLVLVMMRKGAMAARNMVAMTLMRMRRRRSTVTSITTRSVVTKTMSKLNPLCARECNENVCLLSLKNLLNKELSHIPFYIISSDVGVVFV
ncbi:transmembrane protein [Arabidopsis thaliana]|jgi:hypothetical protein|uniref:Transmembrane protein n=2 Tax=Arabidopsis thaliana TaxID=3702 RepID=A0A2H1ZE89_ARATH|nr:uncharacterized protein AT5G39570 [Arabidopsis thaliana]AED94448.2 transmembrane protein [Arabidopsis thaliana]|eukprot:NP_001318706.1 transmembrane protein [Arabidopsis thaliana]